MIQLLLCMCRQVCGRQRVPGGAAATGGCDGGEGTLPTPRGRRRPAGVLLWLVLRSALRGTKANGRPLLYLDPRRPVVTCEYVACRSLLQLWKRTLPPALEPGPLSGRLHSACIHLLDGSLLRAWSFRVSSMRVRCVLVLDLSFLGLVQVEIWTAGCGADVPLPAFCICVAQRSRQSSIALLVSYRADHPSGQRRGLPGLRLLLHHGGGADAGAAGRHGELHRSRRGCMGRQVRRQPRVHKRPCMPDQNPTMVATPWNRRLSIQRRPTVEAC